MKQTKFAVLEIPFPGDHGLNFVIPVGVVRNAGGRAEIFVGEGKQEAPEQCRNFSAESQGIKRQAVGKTITQAVITPDLINHRDVRGLVNIPAKIKAVNHKMPLPHQKRQGLIDPDLSISI